MNIIMDSYDEADEETMRKGKKYNKKILKVPIHELGFRKRVQPDIIDPRNIKRVRRIKKKKYIAKSSKQIFLSRLRLVIDVNQLPENMMSHQFQVDKILHWNYVKKVFCRTRHKIFCYICLEEDIVAPQITFCGHIFCFHCILMHFQKSQNSTLCPVCKQFTQQSQIKTCQPIFDQELKAQEQITFALKYKVGSTIYNCDSLQQDINFNQIIRKRKEAIVQIFEKQENQILTELSKTPETDRNHHYLTLALTLARKKLQNSIQIMKKSSWLKLRPNEKIINNTVLSICEYQSIKLQQKYYQAKNGRSVYLHTLCREYLEKNLQHMPHEIKAKILLMQEQQFDPDTASQYKHLDHLLLGQDFQVAIIQLKPYLQEEQIVRFQEDYDKFLKTKQSMKVKQQAEALIRSQIYEQQLKERRRLQKMMESEYHDIKVPPIMDPSDMNEADFPSLHTSFSQQPTRQSQNIMPAKLSKYQKKQQQKTFNISDNVEDFPDLTAQLKSTKSQMPKKSGNNKKKNRKEKKIDITAEIFAAHQEDYDYN